MTVGFFDIVFECNLRKTCTDCKYKEICYYKFQICFDNARPWELWSVVSSFDHLIKYVNEWREYQNEQATKQ